MRAGLIAMAVAVVSTGQTAAQQLREISIGLSSGSLVVGSLRIAKEMGLFAKYGLDPKIVVLETGNAAVTAMIGGSFDAVAGNTGDLLAAQGRGQKVVALVNLYKGLAPTLVLAKSTVDKLGVSPTAPVSERFKALEGLLIALPSPTANFTLSFRIATQSAKVSARSTYVAAANMPAAMESGAVQGFFTSAPLWMGPVVKGTGVVWLSGPKGEFPPEATPRSSAILMTLRSTIESRPDLAKALQNVMADFAKAVDERPAEVKAATLRAFPNFDAPTVDLFFSYESSAWKAQPLTAKDMVAEIEFVKAGGLPMPNLESLDPATTVYP
jgi:ABC-type nitrate/sulfonate/bicarbonate transport system substrate-binding protein